jgi:hypothetical protein
VKFPLWQVAQVAVVAWAPVKAKYVLWLGNKALTQPAVVVWHVEQSVDNAREVWPGLLVLLKSV